MSPSSAFPYCCWRRARPPGHTSSPSRTRRAEKSDLSADGSTAAFDRGFNLWSRDLRTGTETQLTIDGVTDFRYATNNTGWVHGDDPVVTWSDDSRRIATFQHDGRGVRDLVLAGTNPGAPTLQSWRYPLPGDSVVFQISRVIIDRGADGACPKVVRLKTPPDPHRSIVSDHVACEDGNVCDVQWYPDGSHLAFISSSRDHKDAWLRVAATGAVRDVLHERSTTQIGDASLPEHLWRVLPATEAFPLVEAAEAHRRLEQCRTHGKLVRIPAA